MSSAPYDKYEVFQDNPGFIAKASDRFARAIQNLPFITPNVVTVLSSASILLAVFCILQPGQQYLFASGLLLWLSFFLDSVDGYLARLKKRETHFGWWLDRILGQQSFFVVALGARAYYVEKADARILIFAALILCAQIIKELNWALFQITKQKIRPEASYLNAVTDNLGITFSRQTLAGSLQFYAARLGAFLQYEQYIMLSILPLVIGAKATLLVYGGLFFISLALKLCAHGYMYKKIDQGKFI